MEDYIAAICADRDNPDVYLVFADWLQEQGNPWGELITLQYRQEQSPEDPVLAAAIDVVCKNFHWQHFKQRTIQVQWRWGFMRSIHIFDPLSVRDIQLLPPVSSTPIASLVEECLVFRGSERPLSELQIPAKARIVSRADFVAGLDTNTSWLRVTGTFPKNIGSYKKLTYLECDDVRILPTSLASLPLERIDLSSCWGLEEIPDAVWGIETLGYISMDDCSLKPTEGQANKLLADFKNRQATTAQRIVEVHLLLSKTPNATTEQLCIALDNPMKAIRTEAMIHLEGVMTSPLADHPIGDSSVVSALGSFNIAKKILKPKIEEMGGTINSKISSKTTHVLLGMHPKGKHHARGNLPLLLESHLVSGALDSSQLATDELAAQLRSKDDVSIGLAISAMEATYSIPDEVLLELFLVTQDTSLEQQGKARARAKKLFAAYAPATLRQELGKHFKTSVLLAGESKQREKLSALCKAIPNLDSAHLARLLCEDHQAGFQFMLSLRNAHNIQWALDLRTLDGHLKLDKLEIDALPDLTGLPIRSISARNNHLRAFPKDLPSSLESIDLHNNSLATLPRDLSKHERLTTLILSHNRFINFPKGVTTLPVLEELNLRSDSYGETQITVVPPEIQSMRSLKRLNIENNRVAVALPPEITSLTALEQLQTTWKGAATTPPNELQAMLPNCKIT